MSTEAPVRPPGAPGGFERMGARGQGAWVLLPTSPPRPCAPPPPTPVPPTAGGSLYLFDKKACRYFRKDGHPWETKGDGKTVNETHEKLKGGCSTRARRGPPPPLRRCRMPTRPALPSLPPPPPAATPAPPETACSGQRQGSELLLRQKWRGRPEGKDRRRGLAAPPHPPRTASRPLCAPAALSGGGGGAAALQPHGSAMCCAQPCASSVDCTPCASRVACTNYAPAALSASMGMTGDGWAPSLPRPGS